MMSKICSCTVLGLAGILIVALLGGCAPAPGPRDSALYNHVLQFDPDGFTVDPRNGKTLKPTETKEQFEAILKNIKDCYADGKKQRKILLFVHGGLVSPDDALGAAQRNLQQIARDDPDCYPLFIVWNSTIGDTYREHLFEVRQGQKNAYTKAWGKIDFPIYFLSDLAIAIARSPVVWLQQRATDDEAVAASLAAMRSYDDARHQAATQPTGSPANLNYTEAWMHQSRNANARSFYVELNRRYYDDWTANHGHVTSAMALSVGRDYSTPGDYWGRGAMYVLTLVSKMATEPLIDAFGNAGWQDMTRRTDTVVEGTSSLDTDQGLTDADIANYLNRGTDGGLGRFVTLLAKQLNVTSDAKNPWQVTLVGHSMGAMVLNQVLSRQNSREAQSPERGRNTALPVTNIVYMAAACSIRDFTGTIVPFMESPNHANVKFYNLCLHPTAEMLDTEAYDLVPRGSLLCWIDDFLETPDTPLDRTLGRWSNFMNVPYVTPVGLRGRVAIKAFDLQRPGTPSAYPNTDPQMHGDFSNSPFWDPSFWTPQPPLDPNKPRMQAAEIRKN